MSVEFEGRYAWWSRSDGDRQLLLSTACHKTGTYGAGNGDLAAFYRGVIAESGIGTKSRMPCGASRLLCWWMECKCGAE